MADGDVATVFEGDSEGTGWLRVEELRGGDSLVIRAELAEIDPERDVELTVAEKAEKTGKSGYRSEFRYGALSARQRRKPKDAVKRG